MSSYFGFIPSAQLQSDIETARQKVAQGGKDALYPYRDTVAKGVNDELIVNALVKLVSDLPPNDKKDTMLKLANFIKNQSGSLLSSLLNKADNKDVMKSVDFLEQSAHHDGQGNNRIGFVIPDSLYA
ncbi:MAG: hypothetical protein RLY58_520, partial [Pseudomonadota bacterium]